MKPFFYSDILLFSAAGPFFQFPPPPVAVERQTEGSLINPHTPFLTRDVNFYGSLVSDSPSESSLANSRLTLTQYLQCGAESLSTK